MTGAPKIAVSRLHKSFGAKKVLRGVELSVGVGAATTNAVVSASILILVLNYMLTEAFFSR